MPSKNRFIEQDNSDYDKRIYLREFSGRMTPRRLRNLEILAKRLTYESDFRSEFDCTGELVSQRAYFTYDRNLLSFFLVQNFDY